MKPIPNPWAAYDDDVEHMLGKDAYTHFSFQSPKDGYYYVWDEQQVKRQAWLATNFAETAREGD